MVRMTIQITEEQAEQLRLLAKEEGTSIAKLVRQGIEMRLSRPVRSEEVRKRAINAVGFIHDGPDLATNHDKYLAEAYVE